MQDARDHLRGAVVAEQVVDPAAEIYGDLLFEHQFAIQAPGAPTVERLFEEAHRVPVRRAAWRYGVADGHGGQCAELFSDVAAALLSLHRLGGISEPRRRTCGNVTVVLSGQCEAFVRL